MPGEVHAIQSMLDDLKGGVLFDSTNDTLHAIGVELDEILDYERTFGDNIAGSVSEADLYIDDAPSKIINGVVVKVDLANVGAGDTYEIRTKYRLESGGDWKTVEPIITATDAQTNPLRVIPMEPYRYGAKVTVKKTVGVDRTFDVETIRET